MEIRSEVSESLDYLRKARRTLHTIPEKNYQEFKTQAYLLSELELLKPDELITLAGTGIKVVFYAKSPTRTTAFRADMDALPVQEATNVDCSSTHPGLMHACGHDAHMASALTLCRLVSENRDHLTENVVILFQPAEEDGAGAARMVEDGALENPKVDRIFTFHIWPGLPAGKIGVQRGPAFAHAMGFNIVIQGKKAHGARPHEGHDAIVAAAALVTMLQSIVSRKIDPGDSGVVTIGKLSAGSMRNIIADEARLEGTIRTGLDTTHDIIFDAIEKMCRAVEQGYDVSVSVEVGENCPAVINDEALYQEFVALADGDIVDVPAVTSAEDFSWYQQKIPGLLALACVGEDASPLHSNTLFFDEEGLLPMLEMDMRLLNL